MEPSGGVTDRGHHTELECGDLVCTPCLPMLHHISIKKTHSPQQQNQALDQGTPGAAFGRSTVCERSTVGGKNTVGGREYCGAVGVRDQTLVRTGSPVLKKQNS